MRIILDLPADQAMALAQMCKRICFDPHIVSLSNPHDGGAEADAMNQGLMSLQNALAQAGVAPR